MKPVNDVGLRSANSRVYSDPSCCCTITLKFLPTPIKPLECNVTALPQLLVNMFPNFLTVIGCFVSTPRHRSQSDTRPVGFLSVPAWTRLFLSCLFYLSSHQGFCPQPVSFYTQNTSRYLSGFSFSSFVPERQHLWPWYSRGIHSFFPGSGERTSEECSGHKFKLYNQSRLVYLDRDGIQQSSILAEN